jgi:hypothetical protein
MARLQAYCAGCGEAFGMTARRTLYNGLQFHHVSYKEKCVETYKTTHPPIPFGRQLWNIVVAPLQLLRRRTDESESGSMSGVPQAGD